VTRRLLAAPLALLVVLAAVLAVAGPAQAATSTVTLGQNGPSPSTVTVKSGDTVVFSNTDTVTHVLKSTSKNWSLSVTLKAKSKRSVAFSSAGTFDYSDTYNNAILGFSQTATGHVVVPASPPPSATPTSRASPSALPSASPSKSPRQGTSASPPAAPTQSGVAVPPPIVGGVAPTPTASGSPGPPPQVAPGGQTPTGTATAPVTHVDYANPAGIVQHSSHGTGLPVALAVLAALGVLTLLVRVLLSAPEARHDIR
jgi:plastocyanin